MGQSRNLQTIAQEMIKIIGCSSSSIYVFCYRQTYNYWLNNGTLVLWSPNYIAVLLIEYWHFDGAWAYRASLSDNVNTLSNSQHIVNDFQ